MSEQMKHIARFVGINGAVLAVVFFYFSPMEIGVWAEYTLASLLIIYSCLAVLATIVFLICLSWIDDISSDQHPDVMGSYSYLQKNYEMIPKFCHDLTSWVCISFAAASGTVFGIIFAICMFAAWGSLNVFYYAAKKKDENFYDGKAVWKFAKK